jgi:hypothetical protein
VFPEFDSFPRELEALAQEAGTCGTSIAHNIKAMMTCLDPFYHIPYKGELLYFISYK